MIRSSAPTLALPRKQGREILRVAERPLSNPPQAEEGDYCGG